jgi:alkenylglycerophosphocholine/alkenylglycerophosphoethanolamine hydrolase
MSVGKNVHWKLWYLSAVVFGAAYLLSLRWSPYPLSYVLKATPAIVLACLALRCLRGRERALMPIAYICAAAGDVILESSSTTSLVRGLLCFLVTQLLFTRVFIARATWLGSSLPLIGILVVALAILYCLAWPKLASMGVPVAIYLFALATMTSSALMISSTRWIGAGAIAFLVSDAMIGVDTFVTKIPHSIVWIVATYYAAQLMIAWGLFGLPIAREPAMAAVEVRQHQ